MFYQLSRRVWLKALTLFVCTLFVITACTSNPNSVSNPPVSTATVTNVTTNSPNPAEQSSKPRININEAILSELDKIEAKLGVAGLSNRIQAARPYGKVEDLVSKKVVTAEQFATIKDMVSTETVVLTGEAKDVDYALKLGLMKGHLLVAKELLDLQKPDQALPHIGHPVEEIYADIEEQLKERNVKEFKSSLMTLGELVKSKPQDAKVMTSFTESMTAIDNAIATLPTAQRANPKFILQVINGLLDAANSEYTAAIANGKIKEVIEYQDSRGFVIYADQLYAAIAPQMTKEHADEHAKFTANITQLKTAWPGAIAPSTPVLTASAVSDLIKSNEGAATKVYSK